jgi:hypothetical protein
MRNIDWTQVLVFGIPAWIGALGGAAAAILGKLNRSNLHMSNGDSLAEGVEQTHAIATANAATLATINDNAPFTP